MSKLIQYRGAVYRLVTAAKTVMYHGTSAQHLRSILKHGLKAEPGHRRFTLQHREDAEDATYGGAYLTPYINKARNYASRAARDDGTDSLLVVLKVESRTESIVPDEDVFIALTDPFTHTIAADLEKTMGWPRGSATALDLLDQERNGKLDLTAWVEPWLDDMKQYEGTRNIPINKPLLLRYRQELTEMLRQTVRYKTTRYRAKDDYEEKLRQEFGIQNRDAERAKFVKMLDALSRKIQRLTDLNPKLSVRSLENIGYAGANRIVGVLQYRYPDALVLDGTVQYGERNPEVRDAIVAMSQHMKKSTWVDRQGRVIHEYQEPRQKTANRLA